VRREGGETWVPADRVVTVAADLPAVYRFLRDRANPNDAAARIRLARWCDANGLRAAAAAEARAAVELSPRSAEAKTLHALLHRKVSGPAPASVPVKPAAASVVVAAADPVDCGAEAFKRFATKVQPVLVNACADCHVRENAGKFRLERTSPDALNVRTATQQNLVAALAQIDRAKPSASPLLLHATTAHGGAAVPPLRDRGVVPYRQLEEWVAMVAGESAPSAPVARAVVPASLEQVPGATKPDEKPATEFGADATAPKEGPKDPFDPAIFNQQHHPTRPKPTGPTPAEQPSNKAHGPASAC
jgi:hypothetical protein